MNALLRKALPLTMAAASIIGVGGTVVTQVMAAPPASATMICTNWFVTGKGTGPFPWTSTRIYLRSGNGGTRSVLRNNWDAQYIRVGAFYQTTCSGASGGGGGGW